jgi:hypothetical protein
VRDLMDDYRHLQRMGVDAVSGMANALNRLVIDVVQTGTKIPAAMRPLLEQLIRSGKLSNEAAAALLGMNEAGVKLEEAEQVAARYGLTLDQLGPKVQQIRITEEAQRIVSDFEYLTKEVGADAGTVMAAMQDKVQKLVTAALTAGFVLPESMRPFLQSMVDAGMLVDANGLKLDSLAGINFATPLNEKFDLLIDKLNDLIDSFSKVGDEGVYQFGRIRREAEITGRAVPRGYSLVPVPGDGGGGPAEPPPPGEPPPPNAPEPGLPGARPQSATINVNIDGATAATAFVPHISETIAVNVGG